MTDFIMNKKALQNLEVHLIFNKSMDLVAKVHVLHTDSSTTVNVFTMNEVKPVQTKTVKGNGFDRKTAALSRMVIDGVVLTDHCEVSLPGPFDDDFQPPAGYVLANRDQANRKWLNCYRTPGLSYLSAIGYTAIQAF